MRSNFDEQLAQLNGAMIKMGAMCEEAIARAAKALIEGDVEMAQDVLQKDDDIDHMERDIEQLCLKLLLRQQPVARDLRQISAALKMITDLERIGDQAADIAEIVVTLDGRTGAECEPIRQMAQATCNMVTESVDAYVKQDENLAHNTITDDDGVDTAFCEVKDSLIQMLAENSGDGEYALDLLMIAKYFERIGDHAVNVAEWVLFSVTGTHKGE